MRVPGQSAVESLTKIFRERELLPRRLSGEDLNMRASQGNLAVHCPRPELERSLEMLCLGRGGFFGLGFLPMEPSGTLQNSRNQKHHGGKMI